MVRFGKYVRIPVAKQLVLRNCFSDNSFRSLTQIARHAGVSRNTVKAYLDLLVGNGQLSEGNRLLNRTRQMRPAVNERRLEKRFAMKRFLLLCAKRGKPVSVNLLQKKFGGDKKMAGEVINSFNTWLASRGRAPLVRRTKSSQPKRS